MGIEYVIILIMVFLQSKHLLIDWCLQPPYEWQNKGTYGHFGGIQHSLKNAIGTALCFMPFISFPMVVLVFIIDFIAHYHIDWAKMNINKKMNWEATKNSEFWMLTGLDQYLHQITYLILIGIFIL